MERRDFIKAAFAASVGTAAARSLAQQSTTDESEHVDWLGGDSPANQALAPQSAG
jgi:hypothetical protein